MRTELYWIEGLWRGRLAIMPRPRGGDWLDDEIQYWRRAGVNVVVSLLTVEEGVELDLIGEAEACARGGLEYISFPMPDRGVPSSQADFLELLRRLESELGAGKGVAIHCRAGIGRSALLAASLQAVAGLDVEAAFQRIVAARGCPVPDTVQQREWVVRFARDLVPASSKN